MFLIAIQQATCAESLKLGPWLMCYYTYLSTFHHHQKSIIAQPAGRHHHSPSLLMASLDLEDGSEHSNHPIQRMYFITTKVLRPLARAPLLLPLHSQEDEQQCTSLGDTMNFESNGSGIKPAGGWHAVVGPHHLPHGSSS
jgi:hypothetical protein